MRDQRDSAGEGAVEARCEHFTVCTGRTSHPRPRRARRVVQVDNKVLIIRQSRHDSDLAGYAVEERRQHAPSRRERLLSAEIDHHVHVVGRTRRQGPQLRLDGVGGAVAAQAIDQAFELEQLTAGQRERAETGRESAGDLVARHFGNRLCQPQMPAQEP